MIIPALDFFNKKIVRLYQGNYDNIKYYKYNVIKQLLKYKSQGAHFIHLVDLNGAQYSENKQYDFLKEIFHSVKDLTVQIGGGIRNIQDVDVLFKLGAARIVIGSLAVTDKNLVVDFFKIYGPERIVLALDVNIYDNKKELYINGWGLNTKILLEDIIKYYLVYGLKYILCTDISKDGTLSGPNLNLYKEIINTFPTIKIQSSGGIGSLNDVINLKKIGVHNIIIGKAILEKKFTLLEANLC
ncbi:1-(5-phosphoribosyl)-5-[(5-phosphoribosylamino)methylideneamino]imidazole-4-carboxamide isomerase [Buchnera aphidicola (Mollitrichosiphum nigrofasciatum)]|uniref:1-(5-phosphoribosyl)-5-[(5- phosphoribosylamino)methylideneamino]imidazole-4- carboxamide isomerase n=1 Tax=Buchnera aphidicola TaxID=9 RepID=UPI0031B7F85A